MSSEPCEIAILFADVAGSTRLYESLGDSAAHARVEACLDLVTAAVLEAGGTIVKRIGDEIMGRLSVGAGGLRLRRRRTKESGGAPSVSAQGRAVLHPRRFPVRACAEGRNRLLRRNRERGGAHGRRRHRPPDHHDRAVRRTAAVSRSGRCCAALAECPSRGRRMGSPSPKSSGTRDLPAAGRFGRWIGPAAAWPSARTWS